MQGFRNSVSQLLWAQKIKIVVSYQIRAARSFDFEFQTKLHSTQFNYDYKSQNQKQQEIGWRNYDTYYI